MAFIIIWLNHFSGNFTVRAADNPGYQRMTVISFEKVFRNFLMLIFCYCVVAAEYTLRTNCWHFNHVAVITNFTFLSKHKALTLYY